MSSQLLFQLPVVPNIMDSSPLEPKAQSKLFLVQVAFVLAFYHSDKIYQIRIPKIIQRFPNLDFLMAKGNRNLFKTTNAHQCLRCGPAGQLDVYRVN